MHEGGLPPFFASKATKSSAAHRGSTRFLISSAKIKMISECCKFFSIFLRKSLVVSEKGRTFALNYHWLIYVLSAHREMRIIS